jgi:hypothetical protein
MQSGDFARMASYEQHPTFPTREFDKESCVENAEVTQ